MTRATSTTGTRRRRRKSLLPPPTRRPRPRRAAGSSAASTTRRTSTTSGLDGYMERRGLRTGPGRTKTTTTNTPRPRGSRRACAVPPRRNWGPWTRSRPARACRRQGMVPRTRSPSPRPSPSCQRRRRAHRAVHPGGSAAPGPPPSRSAPSSCRWRAMSPTPLPSADVLTSGTHQKERFRGQRMPSSRP